MVYKRIVMEYRKLIEIELREFDREALEKSWEWLNDPQLKSLTMTPDFDQESQEKWFESLKTRNDYHLKAGWYNGVPVSVYGLKHITGSDSEIFGYVGEKELWGKTIAIQMMQDIIDYARSRNLESLYCITLKENKRTYRLCSRFGFKTEKEVTDETIMMRLYL